MTIILIISISLFFLISLKLYRVYEHSFKPNFTNKNALEHHKFDIDYFKKNPDFYYANFTKSILNRNFKTQNGVYAMYNKNLNDYVYNVAGVCQYGILNYELFVLKKEEEYLNKFKANLDWILENATYKQNLPYWNYNFDMEHHKAPWASGISQGLAISILVRGYAYYRDNSYLKIAKLASETLTRPIHEGGFKYTYDTFQCWFEECSSNNHILNGHIFSLLGIYDLYRCTNEEKLKENFEMGLIDIKNNIKNFDLNIFSSYDAFSKYLANNSYHKTHIIQFEILFKISNDSFFVEIAKKWDKIFKNKPLKIKLFIKLLFISAYDKIK